MGVTWPGSASSIRPPPPPQLFLTTLSATFLCRVGRILAADRYRPVPRVLPCLVGEDGSSRSSHPRERTEVSPNDLLQRWKCSGSGGAGVGFLLIFSGICAKSVALLVLAIALTLHPLTSGQCSFSISLSEDGDEGAESREGLCPTLWV